ncbi:hypothetical protein VKT23_009424 [Stygiomarasmius scandens]|uniref:Uncharacterized protein n=1 Tax=Marasmiellus scandens TaxID=2682957 RepID=A0ABR1IUE9_9AGAR
MAYIPTDYSSIMLGTYLGLQDPYTPLSSLQTFANAQSTSDRSISTGIREYIDFGSYEAPSTNNFSMYHCKHDDEMLLLTLQKGELDQHNSSRHRLEWLWHLVRAAVPGSYLSESRWLWQSLVRSDDVWLLWSDGDEKAIPRVSTARDLSLPDDLDVVADILRSRIDSPPWTHHSLNSAPLDKLGLPHGARLSVVLWAALLTLNRLKRGSNPFTLDYDIPRLVEKWWDVLPSSVRKQVTVLSTDASWETFCEMKQICYLHCPSMWRCWFTIQNYVRVPSSLCFELPSATEQFRADSDSSCLYCSKSLWNQKPYIRPMYLYGAIKPHIIALFCIQKIVQRFHPHCDWNMTIVASSVNDKGIEVNSAHKLLNYTVLSQIDRWILDFFRTRHVPSQRDKFRLLLPDTEWIPDVWLDILEEEDNLEIHLIETQQAINNRYTAFPTAIASPPSDSCDGPSWICAVVLFLTAKYTGFGPAAARTFEEIIENDFSALFKTFPEPAGTDTTDIFLRCLKNSGHTCFNDSTARLYSSAYLLLVESPDVPVVGYGQRVGYQGPISVLKKCSVCECVDAIHQLGHFVDQNMGVVLGASSRDSDMETLSSRVTGKLVRISIKFFLTY